MSLGILNVRIQIIHFYWFVRNERARANLIRPGQRIYVNDLIKCLTIILMPVQDLHIPINMNAVTWGLFGYGS